MNRTNTKDLWKNLEDIKDHQRSIGSKHNTKLSDFDIVMLIFIGSHTRIAITRIVKHKYFAQYGLSTIKRSVHKLISINLVSQGEWKLDDRKKLLSVNLEVMNTEDLLWLLIQ